jgi:hypothetical protein
VRFFPVLVPLGHREGWQQSCSCLRTCLVREATASAALLERRKPEKGVLPGIHPAQSSGSASRSPEDLGRGRPARRPPFARLVARQPAGWHCLAGTGQQRKKTKPLRFEEYNILRAN